MTARDHSNLDVAVLAAGEGTRMRSATPKVLHPICGRPMLRHVLGTLDELAPARIVVVVGHGSEQVRAAVDAWSAPDHRYELAEQPEQRGTGDAMAVALGALVEGDAATDVLVVLGDVPLIRSETLAGLVAAAS